MRCELLQSIGADIISINETHLVGHTKLVLEGYEWYGHNRETHIYARTGSGGVGFFVKLDLFKDFNVTVIDKVFEGIIGISIKHKISEHESIFYSVYLPPENSTRGQDSTHFYGHLLSQVYLHEEADLLVICGDVNGRIGEKSDYISGIDNILPRVPLDKDRCNAHGDTLIEFLMDSKMCISNGRVNPEGHDFTYITTRERLVVNYMIIPHDCLKHMSDFSVKSTVEFINHLGLAHLITENCRVPDHSLLVGSFCFDCGDHDSSTSEYENIENVKRRYYLQAMPQSFMQSQVFKVALMECIAHIEHCDNNQVELDGSYAHLCEVLFAEMDNELQYKDVCSNRTAKRLKTSKPYWNQHLTDL